MSKPQIKKLEQVRHENFHLGEALDDLINAHDNTTNQLQSDPNGAEIIPADITGLQVSTQQSTIAVSGGATVQLGGGVHLAITDNTKIGRAVHYFVEYDLTPDFRNPWVEHLGPGRNRMISLPNGNFFFRAYSQYPAGGPPSSPVLFAQKVTIANSPYPPLLPSQASGTGKPATGGGHGAGKIIKRV